MGREDYMCKWSMDVYQTVTACCIIWIKAVVQPSLSATEIKLVWNCWINISIARLSTGVDLITAINDYKAYWLQLCPSLAHTARPCCIIRGHVRVCVCDMIWGIPISISPTILRSLNDIWSPEFGCLVAEKGGKRKKEEKESWERPLHAAALPPAPRWSLICHKAP